MEGYLCIAVLQMQNGLAVIFIEYIDHSYCLISQMLPQYLSISLFLCSLEEMNIFIATSTFRHFNQLKPIDGPTHPDTIKLPLLCSVGPPHVSLYVEKVYLKSDERSRVVVWCAVRIPSWRHLLLLPCL